MTGAGYVKSEMKKNERFTLGKISAWGMRKQCSDLEGSLAMASAALKG
jgi:hypothetical protein